MVMYGGAVRNTVLGAKTSLPDYDFIGNFDPDEVQLNHSDLVIGRWDGVNTMRLRVANTTYDLTWTDKDRDTAMDKIRERD